MASRRAFGMQLLIQYPFLISRFAESGILDSFSDKALKHMLGELVDDYQREGVLRFPRFLASQQNPEIVRLLTSLSCREEFTKQEAAAALETS